LDDYELIAALVDADPTSRRRALKRIGAPDAPAYAEPMRERIAAALLDVAGNADKNVRNAAAWAFAGLARRSATGNRWLERAATSDVARVRFLAARAFRFLEQPWEPCPTAPFESLLPLLGDEVESVRWAAAGALSSRALSLARVPGEPHENEENIINRLVAATTDSSPTVRAAAVSGLGRSQNERAVRARLAGLRDRDRRVRLEASYANRDTAAIRALIEALDDEYVWVRNNAARTLGGLKARSAVPALLRKLESSRRDTRAEAALALATIGDLRAVEPLLALFERATTVEVRVPVAEALGRLGDERAVPVLTAALQDTGQERGRRVGDRPFYPLRRAAADALRRIEGTPPPRLP
jgi:HEAT repeat protein